MPNLNSIIRISGNIEPHFERTMIPLIESIDSRLAILLESRGYGIVLTPTVVDHLPRLRRLQPRGWGQGSTWLNADGCHSGQTKEIVVAQGNWNQSGKLVESTRWKGVFVHELGHGIDQAMEYFSRTIEFVEAYLADIAKIANTPIEKELSYYMQGFNLKEKGKLGPAGLSEAFAEVTAALLGYTPNKKDRQLVLRVFGNTARLLRTKFRQLPSIRLAF